MLLVGKRAIKRELYKMKELVDTEHLGIRYRYFKCLNTVCTNSTEEDELFCSEECESSCKDVDSYASYKSI